MIGTISDLDASSLKNHADGDAPHASKKISFTEACISYLDHAYTYDQKKSKDIKLAILVCAADNKNSR